ncbi:MAG: LuxR family transcriptional regulator [Acidaminococcaceae bacterium]|nr:LuxR family transcriptional regulator [Acidaminococcaceae bacterium]MBR1589727.1 LuxR family transcriptional regulator [Acidaminococcaceae bacterium]
MKKQGKLVTQWLQFVGKEKLQSFQDNFAGIYGVSLIFLDLNGQPLTVGSKNNLFCFTIEKEHAVRCQENFQLTKEKMQQGKPFTHVCPFGITCLYVPAFFNNRLAAYAAVGGFTYTNSPIPEHLKKRFHISTYTKEKTEEMLLLLDSMLRLLNMNLFLSDDKTPKKENLLPVRMRDDRISRREYEIIRLLCKGYSNKQIAEKLFISAPTVKTHISNILAKLNLRGRMQIIVRYYGESEMMNQLDANDTGDSDR